LPRDGEAIELEREFGTLVPHAPGLAEGRASFDLNRVGYGGQNHPPWTN
jgi:hypothetical protein